MANKRDSDEIVQMGFDLPREKQNQLRDRADENGQKLVWIMNKLVDYYLEHGMPKKEEK